MTLQTQANDPFLGHTDPIFFEGLWPSFCSRDLLFAGGIPSKIPFLEPYLASKARPQPQGRDGTARLLLHLRLLGFRFPAASTGSLSFWTLEGPKVRNHQMVAFCSLAKKEHTKHF